MAKARYILNPLLFFIISISLFPLAISPEASTLSQIAAGIIWVAIMLAVLLSLNSLFHHDFDNGILEQMLISHHSLPLLILSNICSNFIEDIRIFVYTNFIVSKE
jgi:heme exporter protein B